MKGLQQGGMDPFEQMFRQQQQQRKVRPMVADIVVTLADIYTGKMKEVSFNRKRICDGCEGKGGKDAKKCGTCKGHGVVERLIQIAPGFVTAQRAHCPDCQGQGMIFDKENLCQKCQGKKIFDEDKTMEVPVEQGCPSEHHVQFTGEGNAIPDVLAGDLVVRILCEKHEVFDRKGADLIMKKKISLYEALCGTAFSVVMPDGVKIVIATSKDETISTGTRKQIKGKGMPCYKDTMNYGNLYIDFEVVIPKKSELQNIELLAKVLPVPELENVEKEKILSLEEFDVKAQNTNAEGGKARAGEEDDEEGDGHFHGQRQQVNCSQQ